MEEIVEVNGAKYSKLKKEVVFKDTHPKIIEAIRKYTASSADRVPNADVPVEYGLIQKKQSTLSSRKREWVVFQFERNYKQID